jgi:hypothetical protein
MGLIYTHNTSGAIRKLRKKKPTKSYVSALKKHIEWLKSLGLNVNQKGKIILAKRETTNILVNEERPKQNLVPQPKTNPNMGNGGTKKDERWKLEISKQYSILPAYNKGPYMVVSKSDLKTAGRKV